MNAFTFGLIISSKSVSPRCNRFFIVEIPTQFCPCRYSERVVKSFIVYNLLLIVYVFIVNHNGEHTLAVIVITKINVIGYIVSVTA